LLFVPFDPYFDPLQNNMIGHYSTPICREWHITAFASASAGILPPSPNEQARLRQTRQTIQSPTVPPPSITIFTDFQCKRNFCPLLLDTYENKNALQSVDDSDRIKDDMTISGNIESPIEQRNDSRGNPNVILHFGRPLNTRQQKLLDSLPEYDSRTIVPKNSVKMSDLSALTAITGVEFAMFTKGNERLVVRGNEKKVDIDPDVARLLSKQGYKWSGHTHVGTNPSSLIPSDGDLLVLKEFKQNTGVIYNSSGAFSTFRKGG
jgi:hypothetical protein